MTLVISNQLSIEDAEAVASASGKKTLYVYDARNRKISESFPGHVPASLPNVAGYDKVLVNYDAMDRAIAKIDQKGESTGFVFDLAGRLMTRSYRDNANDTFTYDTASRMTSAQSARYSNLVTRSYNATSTLASESLSVAGKTYTVQYGYDNKNRNTSITYPSGKVVTRGYSVRDELESVTYDNASVITRTYDAGRRLFGTIYGNSKVESRTYRNDNLLNTLATPGVTALSYAWDANKNKTSETDTFANAYSWTTGSGGYDSLDRLVSWSRTNGNAQSWNLSPVGNWNNWTYNGNQENRTHNDVHEVTQRNNELIAYDAKGNMTENQSRGIPGATFWYFDWDYDNRLTQVTVDQGDAVSIFTYDALGRRVSSYPYSTTGVTTIYVSSLQQEIAEYVSGANANAPTYEYVFGSYIDEVLMRVTSSSATKHYYHHDAQYCVRSLSDSTGAVVERYAYDPYGRPIYLTASGALSTTQSSSVNNTILYTGRRFDTETGLYYFRARYQDPVLGRFLSRDPIGFEGSEWNLYEYVRGTPLKKLDPKGLHDEDPGLSCSCGIKSFDWTIGGCGPHYNIASGDWGIGQKFNIDVLYGKKCQCCQFNQFVKVTKRRISFRYNDGTTDSNESEPDGSMSEDCIVSGGQRICYGDRNLSGDFQQWDSDGCGLHTVDTPGWEIGRLIASKNLNGPVQVEWDFEAVFAIVITDVCYKPRPARILSETRTIRCSGRVEFQPNGWPSEL